MEEVLTSNEITEWQGYELNEPFGEVREDIRAGTIAALLFNINRSKGQAAMHWYDFFPNVAMPRKEIVDKDKAAEQVVMAFKAWNEKLEQKRKAVKTKLWLPPSANLS